MLQKFEDVFPNDGSSGLPPKERKELHCQMKELISPCVVLVLFVPKNDGLLRICIYFRSINNIIVKIWRRIFSMNEGNEENQSTKDPLQMPIGPITSARTKKLQEVFNGLVKEFIWANPALKEEPKSNQVFEGIGAYKKVQKFINVIMTV